MSRFFKSKLVLVIVIVIPALIVFLFALDSWYKDFGPTYERLQGRWICDSIAWEEGVTTHFELCGNRNFTASSKSISYYYFDWTYSEVAVNLDGNKIGTGTYKLGYPWSVDTHEAIMEIDMNFPASLAYGALVSGNYIVEMDSINDLELRLEDGNIQGYRIEFHRQNKKFDLSVIADYLNGF